MLTRRLSIAVVALVLIAAAACAEEQQPSSSGSDAEGELIVQVASYEVTTDGEQRVLLGLLMPDQRFVSFGSVDVEFFYLGTEEGRGEAEQGPTSTADFLLIPDGEHHADPPEEAPIAAPASQGRGVYSTHVAFDRAGFWSAQVTADVANEGKLSGNSVFEVVESGQVPEVGERAPRTDNLTLASEDAPIGAVDSRAANGGRVPDEGLHRMTIAESIENREPALVVFATPVYCVSRFCGPITDMVEDLAKAYDDKANFIHVEIWRNYENQVINKGAAEWLYHGSDLTEPWVFLIGADGRVEARWDNVATPEEIEPYLRELPPL